jgi:hypothetical protein
MPRLSLAVMAGAALIAAAPVSASVTFDNLQLASFAGTYATDGTAIDTDSDSNHSGNIFSIQPLFSRSAQATSAVDPARSDASNASTLAFSGPGSLTLTVTNSSSLLLPTSASYGNTNASGQVNYSFTLLTAQSFSFVHDMVTSSPFTFSSAILFKADGGPMDPPAFARDGVGELADGSGLLAAGRYRLFLATTSGLNFGGFERSAVAETTSNTLRFSIAAVPEPQSWAMIIAGFGLAGLGLRTRRTGSARPA